MQFVSLTLKYLSSKCFEQMPLCCARVQSLRFTKVIHLSFDSLENQTLEFFQE